MSQPTLNHPPFPPLAWDGFFWAGEAVLPGWNKVLALNVDTGSADRPPTPEQVAAYQYLLNHGPAVEAAVFRALADYCPGEAYDSDDENDPFFAVETADDVKRFVRPVGVHVSSVTLAGAAYVGFEFGCEWDEEHGAGVLTHNGRVASAGQATTAFVAWIAERDAKKQGG